MVYGIIAAFLKSIKIAPITLLLSMDSFYISARYDSNDSDDIDPFCNRTGRLLQNTSQINRWPIVIFCWEYLAKSEVGSLRKLLF